MSKFVPLAFAIYILWLLVDDTRRRGGVSPAVWGAVAWVVLLAARPLSTWFDFGGEVGVVEASEEGSPIERMVYLFLILQGLVVLALRRIRLRDVVTPNGWLLAFFLYWGLSVLWADTPLVALKRWVKDLGNVVMALVILTDGKPLEAMKAVFARSAGLLMPVSAFLILFVPELASTSHVWSGELMYTGVTSHKNSLGVLVLVSLMFLVWDFIDHPPEVQVPRSLWSRLGSFSLIVMGGWLLVKSASATSIGCMVAGAVLLIGLRWRVLRARVRYLEFFAVLAGLGIWVTGAAHYALEFLVVEILGRDLSLTTRTDIWPLLLSKADNFLFGSGFNSFWTGDRLAVLYGQLGIVQAHNGYLETYLNGGLLGLALLAMVLVSAVRLANKHLVEGRRGACLAFAVVLVTAVYNITEASFDKTTPLWFAFLLVVLQYQARETRKQLAAHRILPKPVAW